MKWFITAILSVMLAGCESMSLPDNATPQERIAARCSDAQFASTLAVEMLKGMNLSPEAKAYWQAYKRGARLTLETYCPEGGGA